jgi:hypothetical protein
MQLAGEGPSAGLDREEQAQAGYPTTCSDGIADRRSWYSPMLRGPKVPKRITNGLVHLEACPSD